MENRAKPLEKEFEFFRAHLPEFNKEHPNKYVEIVDNKVVGYFPNITEAILFSKKKYEPGTFFVELCTPDPSYYNVSFLNWNV